MIDTKVFRVKTKADENLTPNEIIKKISKKYELFLSVD